MLAIGISVERLGFSPYPTNRGEFYMAVKKGNENLMAALTYVLGVITGVIFLLVEKKSAFVRFHAMQSTIFFGGVLILNIALNYIYIPVLGGLASMIIGLVSFIAWVVLIIKALQGEKYKLPYVGDLAEEQLKKI